MPFNPLRYSIILGTGLTLFIAGSLFNEVVIDKKNLSFVESFKLVFFSLTLAIGIGMISGGISHFKENPEYVSYLIPLGILISFFSFKIKNHIVLSKKENIISFIVVTIFSFILFLVLSLAASGMLMTMPIGGDIFSGGH
jgi:hypothetical protein